MFNDIFELNEYLGNIFKEKISNFVDMLWVELNW